MSGLIVILVVFNIVLFLYLLSLIIKKESEDGDNAILLNFSNYGTHGRALGIVKDQIIGAGNRVKITMTPKDIDLNKLIREKKKLEDIDIMQESHKLVNLPKGTLSRDKNIVISLPKSPEDMSDGLKKTQLGVALQFLTLEQDFIKKRIDILSDKVKNRDALLKEIGDAEMSVEYVTKIKEFHKDVLGLMLDAKEAKKGSQDSTNSLKLNIPQST